MDNNMIFTRKTLVDATHVDRWGRMRPASLLEVMQETAGDHAALLGVGREQLDPRGLFWAIVRQTIEIHRLPGIGETVLAETWPGPPSRTAYPRYMVGRTPQGEELFRAVEAGATPILFHCSAGKDRTGVAAMLILLALGASDETICADFVQTNVCRKAEIDALLASHAEEIAADPSKRMRFFTQAGVDPGAAPYVLQVIREACGSAEEYLAREYGLTPARRMRLRRMYLE